jgi:hypothetical protein
MSNRNETLLLKKYLKEMEELLNTKKLTNEILAEAIIKMHKDTLNEILFIRRAVNDIQEKL